MTAFETVAITFSATMIAFLVVAAVVGTLWSRTESYRDHMRFKRDLHNAKRGVSPIIED